MRAYEFSRYLVHLAKLLKSGPDFDLEDLRFGKHLYMSSYAHSADRRLGKDDLPVALSALVALSRIDKQEWTELISELGLPIQIRSRDASRDILGKLLRVLEKDRFARDLLTKRVKSRHSAASPELLRALSTLLK